MLHCMFDLQGFKNITCSTYLALSVVEQHWGVDQILKLPNVITAGVKMKNTKL